MSDNKVVPRKLGVCIGRFSLPHNEHARMLRKMADENDLVLILVGSSNRRTSNKNPFTYEERTQMLGGIIQEIMERPSTLRDMKFSNRRLPDSLYNETRWEAKVQQLVDTHCEEHDIDESNVTLYGCDKDESTYYLRNFPQWKHRDHGKLVDIDSTRLRDAWFESMQFRQGIADEAIFSHLPRSVSNWLSQRSFDANVQADWQYYKDEAVKFKDYPYPDTLTFTCADAVLECAGHVLCVTRAAAPGIGCLALPGGFKNRGENLVDAAIRETFEETNLRIPHRVMKNCVRGSHLFDHPSRSNGIPRITYATHFKIEPRENGSLPRAKGGDDAKNDHLPNGGCVWVPIGDILAGKVIMYDDHADIVEYFVK
jgi:bifunctional NMN adenylyltransferase/nudix hydrolase